MTNKLSAFLRLATQDEKTSLAVHAGTTENYLYQLAGGHRTDPATSISVGIENGTRALRQHNRKLPVVTVADVLAIPRRRG